ncbi:DUF4352 domain-containing protein [Methanoculleus caldifontis]|nr:hypothetical protein [Methanoculleus sp. Wushi-C6]
MILALLVFTSFLFSPSPTAAGSVPADPAHPQPVVVRNLSSVLAGVEERIGSGHPLSATPGTVPADGPAVPGGNESAGQDENTTPPAPEYDDDELVRLVSENSVSLMLLSVQNAYALYAWDEKPARESAAALRASATGLLKRAGALRVSDDAGDLSESFTLALTSYVAAAEALQGTTPLNRTMVDAALDANRQGSNYLRDASEHLESREFEAPGEIVAVNLSLPRPSASGDELVLFQRYNYEDRYRANDISLMLESVRGTGMYHFLDKSGEAVTAEAGRIFLLVKVRATNLGHKGENRIYTIRSPDIREFTLYYRGTAYAPVKLASGTSLGEPYAAATLGRYESKTGYIVFDVPAAIPIDECFVRVNLGSSGSPVWALGRTL